MFPLCFTRKHSLIHHPPPCKWTTPPSVSHNNNNDTSSLYVCVCVCFALIPYRKRTGIYSANPWLCFHQLSQSHSHQTHSRWNWLLANETDHRPIEGEEEEGTYVSEQIHFHDRHLFSNSLAVSILIIFHCTTHKLNFRLYLHKHVINAPPHENINSIRQKWFCRTIAIYRHIKLGTHSSRKEGWPQVDFD